jgi:hypothetical protein
MRGTNAILGFALMGVCALLVAWALPNFPIGTFCGDKQGCLPFGTVLVLPDLWSLAGMIAAGTLGLIMLTLVANGLVRLSRLRR